jgi:hypothetical protein
VLLLLLLRLLQLRLAAPSISASILARARLNSSFRGIDRSVPSLFLRRSISSTEESLAFLFASF